MINICFAIDGRYVDHCAVVIASILNNSGDFFNFIVVSNGLTEKNKKRIDCLKKIKNFELKFIDIDLKDFEGCFLPSSSHFSLANYFRLKLPSLLKNIEKVIYLDCDIVVNADLEKLWNIPMENSYIIGCESMNSENNCKRLGLPVSCRYINSGVLVMDLIKMRNDEIESAFFDLIKETRLDLENVDQDVINMVLLDKDKGIKHIEQNWNTEIRTDIPFTQEYLKVVKNPFIIHFLTGEKPWNKNSKQLYKEEYWKYRNIVEKIDCGIFERIKQLLIRKKYVY